MKLTANPGLKAAVRLRRGIPAWELAHLFPLQGHWTESDYLAIANSIGNQLVELDEGRLDVLAMPNLFHQDLVMAVFLPLDSFVESQGLGEAFQAPLPIRFSPTHYRMPDITFLKRHRIKDKHQPPHGADLVMEVVGSGEETRERDLTIKRRAYAKAKVREYWIIDPVVKTIMVLALVGKAFKVYGEYKPGEQAASKMLKGFSVDVAEVFAAGEM